GIGELLVDSTIQGGITHSNHVVQRNANNLIEKAPKTIKDFFSKMVEKVARINEEQAKNLIEKVKDTMDNVDKIDSNVSNSILEILKKHGKGNEGEMTKAEIEQIFKLFEYMGFDEKQKNGLGSIKEIFDGYLDNPKSE
uniref:EF-hand domain-containing protein n=1 Tax=Meloidogyne javanica TaxID=6303 RepID=A0A915LZD6_MELJA